MMPIDVAVRPMELGDLRSVLRIENSTPHGSWSQSLFRTELGRPNRMYLVAIAGPAGPAWQATGASEASGCQRPPEGMTVVGFSGLLIAGDEGHIMTIAVDAALQGRGIASRMLHATCVEAIAQGVGALTLEVRTTNEAAQALYRKFGFAPAGVRKNYYSDSGEDGLIMWAHDIGAAPFADRLDEVGCRLSQTTEAAR